MTFEFKICSWGQSLFIDIFTIGNNHCFLGKNWFWVQRNQGEIDKGVEGSENGIDSLGAGGAKSCFGKIVQKFRVAVSEIVTLNVFREQFHVMKDGGGSGDGAFSVENCSGILFSKNINIFN